MRSLMLASLLLTLLFVNKTACDLDAEILKPFADENLAVLLSFFCMHVVTAFVEVPVVQRAMSSAYMDSSTPLKGHSS